MIEVGLEFQVSVEEVLGAFVTLPGPLRPVHFSETEVVRDAADRVEDERRLAAFAAKCRSGFFLLAPGLTYSIRIAAGKPIVCDGFLDTAPGAVKDFLRHLATATPTFGFGCAPEERAHRNRVSGQQGQKPIEGWVGRDTDRYVPGLYWLTMLSENLIRRHGVSLAAIEEASEEQLQMAGRQHLFQLYPKPDDWRSQADRIDALCASIPGIFSIERVKPQVAEARSFLELTQVVARWR